MKAAKRVQLATIAVGVAAIAAASLAAAGPSTATAAAATPIYLNPAYSPAERAADLVSRMTTAEKAQQMDSSEAPAIPTALTQNIHTLTDTYNIGDVDTSLVRLFTARIETGEFDAESQVPWVAAARKELGGATWTNSAANEAITETPQRLRLDQDVADQSIVLLKNAGKNPLLPLKVPSSGPYKLAVMGYFAPAVAVPRRLRQPPGRQGR